VKVVGGPNLGALPWPKTLTDLPWE